jgi:hypothetical protein
MCGIRPSHPNRDQQLMALRALHCGRISREKPNGRDLGRCPNLSLARKSVRNKDWNFVPDAEPRIAVLMDGALVRGVGEPFGSSQRREIIQQRCRFFPSPLWGGVGVVVGR